ncbi:MAG: TrpR YerC/YecD [Ruminococcaceae bacterium]|nr:TrpR YerC/YecD [Oscillospiraceae bacterium]
MIKLKCESVDDFFDAVLTLENREECYKFFSDVCTTKEVKAIAQRFTVAKMLKDKKVYTEIVSKTGASTATISRVNRSLEDSNNGYDIVFERLEK